MRMTDAARIREFMFAGNATFTLVSVRTGTRFTYKLVRKKDDAATLYLKVLSAPDLYRFTGVVSKGGPNRDPRTDELFFYWHSHAKGQMRSDAPSVQAFAWFIDHVQKVEFIHPQLEFWHEGKCGKCGRALTVPASIATGLGPDCAAMMGVKMKEGVAA